MLTSRAVAGALPVGGHCPTLWSCVLLTVAETVRVLKNTTYYSATYLIEALKIRKCLEKTKIIKPSNPLCCPPATITSLLCQTPKPYSRTLTHAHPRCLFPLPLNPKKPIWFPNSLSDRSFSPREQTRALYRSLAASGHHPFHVFLPLRVPLSSREVYPPSRAEHIHPPASN